MKGRLGFSRRDAPVDFMQPAENSSQPDPGHHPQSANMQACLLARALPALGPREARPSPLRACSRRAPLRHASSVLAAAASSNGDGAPR